MNPDQRPRPNGVAANGTWKFETCISSDAHECCSVIRELVGHLRQDHWNDSDVFGIHLSLEEAIANALHHGNSKNRRKTIKIRLETTLDSFYAQITDEGCGFDPRAIPDPTMPENRDKPCGRGLMLMRSYMDNVTHSSSGNSVELFKKRTQ